MTDATNIYVLGDNPDDAERARLRYLEGRTDPTTFRHLERIGVAPGWRCLEVAAGGGSVARWLAGRVGPSGSVLATDIDPRFLTDLPDNVEVRRHDIDKDELETGFDLAHCRTLLMHLPDPVATLQRMVGAVRPGAWLLVEDIDFGMMTGSGHPDAVWATGAWQAFCTRLRHAGLMDGFIGRKLPAMAGAAGLEDVGAELHSALAGQGTAEWDTVQHSLPALRPAAIASGTPEAEYDRMGAVLTDPAVTWIGICTVSVWGRRPG